MQLDFSVIWGYLPMFGSALIVTLKVTFCSLFFALLLSVPLSLCKISNIRPLEWLAAFYTSVFRGVPILVQVFMTYFGIPIATGVKMSAFTAGVVVFSMNSAAYISESMRSAQKR